MTGKTILHDGTTHKDVVEIRVVDDQLILTLRNSMTLSIPCKALSLDHMLATVEERDDLVVDHETHELIWPQLQSTLAIDTLLDEWLSQSGQTLESIDADMRAWLAQERTRQQANDRLEVALARLGRRQLGPVGRESGWSQDRRIVDLYNRVKRLEFIIDLRESPTPPSEDTRAR